MTCKRNWRNARKSNRQDAKLSPERFWWAPRSQEVVGLHCHHQNDSALRWAAMRAILTFYYLWGVKAQDSVHKPQLLKESWSGFEPKSACLPPKRFNAGPSWLLSPFLTGRMFVRPNILRTLRRTMIRFLIELLVRRIWFGQSKLYFILIWLVMRCKLLPKLEADAQQTAWSKM